MHLSYYTQREKILMIAISMVAMPQIRNLSTTTVQVTNYMTMIMISDTYSES